MSTCNASYEIIALYHVGKSCIRHISFSLHFDHHWIDLIIGICKLLSIDQQPVNLW